MRTFAFALCFSVALLRGASAETALPPATIVVFNGDLPDSRELAEFYAEHRGIPRDHLVALSCSVGEEISRDEYDKTIRDPLRKALREHGWWKIETAPKPHVAESSVHFVAVIRGVPLKIRSTTSPDPDDHIIPGQGPVGSRNEASVDSEVAALGALTPQISGSLQNPYYNSYRPVTEINAPGLLLVSRLDAPDAATVRRMITDAIETERDGLWGRAFVDGAHNTSGGLEIGDEWLTQVVTQLHKIGVPVVFDDKPEIFPSGFPINNCSLYYGWYAADISGALADPQFRFLRGAVAVHIHSFSAATLHRTQTGWTAPLISRGAAASLGNVYEPYLQLTTHLDIFNDRLLHGFTLAESAAMATPAISWMTIVVGDPLYRPFGNWLQLDAAKAPNEWRAYHDFVTKNSSRPDFRNAARQFALRTKNGPMLEELGARDTQDGNFASATASFDQARTIYANGNDILRVVLEESDAWLRWNKPARALDLIRSVSRFVTDAPAASLLREKEQEAKRILPSASRSH